MKLLKVFYENIERTELLQICLAGNGRCPFSRIAGFVARHAPRAPQPLLHQPCLIPGTAPSRASSSDWLGALSLTLHFSSCRSSRFVCDSHRTGRCDHLEFFSRRRFFFMSPHLCHFPSPIFRLEIFLNPNRMQRNER